MRLFLKFGEGDDVPETCVHVENAPRIGDTIRLYVSAWHGREDVEDAPNHLATDGMPWIVTMIERAYCRNYRGEWSEEVTATLRQ